MRLITECTLKPTDYGNNDDNNNNNNDDDDDDDDDELNSYQVPCWY